MKNLLDPAPGGTDVMSPHLARRRVLLPALLLLVTGAAGLATGARVLWDATHSAYVAGGYDASTRVYEPLVHVTFEGVRQFKLYWALLSLVPSGLTLVGALRMVSLRNYQLAMVASVSAMVPCVGPLCGLGAAVGIWSFLLLDRPEIKSAFRG